jgi:hypothetical protein
LSVRCTTKWYLGIVEFWKAILDPRKWESG